MRSYASSIFCTGITSTSLHDQTEAHDCRGHRRGANEGHPAVTPQSVDERVVVVALMGTVRRCSTRFFLCTMRNVEVPFDVILDGLRRTSPARDHRRDRTPHIEVHLVGEPGMRARVVSMTGSPSVSE